MSISVLGGAEIVVNGTDTFHFLFEFIVYGGRQNLTDRMLCDERQSAGYLGRNNGTWGHLHLV